MQVRQEQVNAYRWGKQGFDRAPKGSYEMVRGLNGLYGTARAAYLGLLARVPDFHFSDLDDELYERRRVARLRAMRASMFCIADDRLPVTYQATKEMNVGAFQKLVQDSGVDAKSYAKTTKQIEAHVAEQPLTVSEIKKVLQPKDKAVNYALNFIVALMCAEGRLLRARVQGSWKSDRFSYARFEDWLQGIDLESVATEEAQVSLARSYFAACGPASAADFHWWSGLKKAEAESALSVIREELIAVKIGGIEGDYLLPKAEEGALLGAEADEGGLRLLPVWDAYLMGYSQREGIVPAERYKRVFDKGGNATSVILSLQGVLGVWDMQEEKERLIVKAAFFNEADALRWQALKDYAARIAEAIGFKDLEVQSCPPPASLHAGGQNLFRSPLKDVTGKAV